jgi:uncharacterized protein YkwD
MPAVPANLGAAKKLSVLMFIALWMGSAGHRAIILDCRLRETGVGYIKGPRDKLNYGAYWTQDFGAR